MNKARKSIAFRLKILLILSIALSIYLIIRLGKFQIVDSGSLKKEALEQWAKSIELKANRGNIYDKNGKKMAISVSAYTVWASPGEITNPEITAQVLSEILEMEKEELLEKLTREKNVEKIKQWINRETANQLREEKLKGISIVEDSKRYYPSGNFASYVLGFNDIDNNGLYGLERTYNDYLSGNPGKWMKMTDSYNRQLPYDGDKIISPQDGNSLILTIDETIQYFAEKNAEEALLNNKAKNISIIIMDPRDGSILAMVNKPDYDPNEPRKPLDPKEEKEWENLMGKDLENKWFEMWRNFAISDIYEPGSTFKLITTVAALEENTSSLNSSYYCNGFVKDIKGEVLRCARWYDPHGSQSLKEAVNNSCNVAFVNIARELGSEKFLKYIRAFGFGEKTNIDLIGEQAGIIPKSANDIKEINLATMSYGQGIAVTPIQLITAVSAIANGGYLMEPRLVKKIIDKDGNIISDFNAQVKRQVISKASSEIMLELMESVVKEGSGSRAYLPGYSIGGKTGTAEKVVDGIYAKGKYIASFIGLAPIENPEIAILVIVDEPQETIYGGSVAAPIARDIFEEIFSYLEIPASSDNNGKDSIGDRVQVPDVRNLLLPEAGKILTKLGFKYTTEYVNINEETKVLDQFPLPNEEVEKGSIIDLYIKTP